MGGRTPDDERFEARLNEADAMFTVVSDAGGVPYAPVSLNILSKDHADPAIRARFRETRVRLLPAMRRRIVWDRFSTALPRWVEVPGWDITDNILELPPPGDGSMRAILDWTAEWASQPFAPDRPPWRSVLFKDVYHQGEGGRVVIVNQQHHAVIDGGGSTKMNDRWKELRPKPGELPELPPPVPYDTTTAFERWKEGWAQEGAKAREVARNTSARLRWAATHPVAGARRARELAGALRRMQGQQSTSGGSPLLRRRSDELRLDWLEIDGDALRAGAKAVGGTFNDGFLAAMSLALHAYHREHGALAESVRAAMAVNTRTDKQGYQGNRVTGVVMPLPLIDDPATAVKACRELSRSHRDDEDVMWLTDRFRALANRMPRRLVVPMTRRTLSGINVQLSCIHGPQEKPVPMNGVVGMGGCGLPIGAPGALAVTLATSWERADAGIMMDRVAIRDPEVLLRHIEDAFAAVAALAD
jgi:diacylglycerol O-acyltransferase / wax synthase